MPTDQTSMRALPTKIPFLTKTQKEPSAQIVCGMWIWTGKFDFFIFLKFLGEWHTLLTRSIFDQNPKKNLLLKLYVECESGRVNSIFFKCWE